MAATRSTSAVARADLRLVVPGVAAWAGAFVATSGHLNATLAIAGLSSVAAFAGFAWRRRHWVAVACLLGLFAGFAMGAVRLAALHVDVVDQLARDGAQARVSLVVTGDPAARAGRTNGSSRRGSDLVAVPARMVLLVAQGHTVRERLPVLVLAIESDNVSADGLDRWRQLLPGQRLTARVTLQPADADEPLAALALARSPPRLIGRPPPVQRVAG